jgi:2-deoxy-D-gluconate 3-dehydrogenase
MGFVALPGRAAYCAAKAGVVHLTRVLAQEWAPNNVQVNAIAPTFTVVRKPSSTADPAFRDFILQHIPLGRMAEPRDMAGAALFLASPASDFVTGHTLVVDGGWLTL